jgi:hypothetical protein
MGSSCRLALAWEIKRPDQCKGSLIEEQALGFASYFRAMHVESCAFLIGAILQTPNPLMGVKIA